jgi:hypothetical protein
MSDSYKRAFVDDRAQCGCFWRRESGFGDVLHLCPIHEQHSRAELEKYERERIAKEKP